MSKSALKHLIMGIFFEKFSSFAAFCKYIAAPRKIIAYL